MSQSFSDQIEPGQFRCRRCGYDLTGSTIGSRCPECGTSVNDSLRTSPVATNTASSRATTCLILGIVGIMFCQLLCIVPLVMYPAIKRDVDGGTEPVASLSQAKVGYILGWVGLGLLALNVFFVLIWFTLAFAGGF